MNKTIEKPIGIFGGTFDPVHNGHLFIATHVCNQLKLDHIEWIPCNIPAHRKKPSASPTDRLNMLKIATENNPLFRINDCEITRGGISYMIDTIVALKMQYPNAPLCLILGADAFEHLNTWYKWDTLLDYCHIIVINRENYSLSNIAWLNTLCEKHKTNDPSELHTILNGKIYFETVFPINISATNIRDSLASKHTIPNDLPKNVYDYICKTKLYTI